MQWLNIYNKLCERARNRDIPIEFTERHHVIPKCMGGSDDDSNIVRLTLREHICAHLMLAHIYPDNHKLAYALLLFSVNQPTNAKRVVSRFSGLARSKYRATQRLRWTGDKNHMKTQRHRDRQAAFISGENNPIRRFPEKNRTAVAVKVHFISQRSPKEYSYGKAAAMDLAIPYDTFKLLMRNGKSSTKYNIEKVERLI
jgi:hypothetical protein